MNKIILLILSVFVLGITFGLINQNTTTEQLETTFNTIITKTETTIDTVVNLGKGSIEFVQKSIGLVENVAINVVNATKNAFHWLADFFSGPAFSWLPFI